MLGLHFWIQRETWGYKSCVDFGSGLGAYTRSALCSEVVGIESFEPYVVRARLLPDNSNVRFILGDMRDFESHLGKRFEVAMFIDSLEHLGKEDALSLIAKCKDHFDKILLFIPINENKAGNQDYYDDNPGQRHLSEWCDVELNRLGFSTKVIEGFHSHLPVGCQDAAMCYWTPSSVMS